MLGTHLGRPSFQAFGIVTGKKNTSEAELIRARAAVKLANNALLGMGILYGFIAFLLLLPIRMKPEAM